MIFFALLPLLVASALAGEILLQPVEPLPRYNHESNSATGEYGYSYSGGPSAKTEFRAIDGTTTGAYSYVDAHGLLQTVNYIADEFGFRAAGTNIPHDAPDVAAVKAAHLAEHSRASLAALGHERKKRGILAAPAIAVPVLPAATSSQSRFQIHNGAKIVTEHHVPAYVAAPALLSLHRKKRGILAAPAIALPVLPAATSSQSRFQIHNGAKIITEHHVPAYVAAPALLSLHRKKRGILAAPAIAVPVLPTATSSQSRFQIHNGAKIVTEHHAPAYVAAPALLSLHRKKRGIFAYAAPLAATSAKIYQEFPSQAAFLEAAPTHLTYAAPAAPLSFAAPVFKTVSQQLPYSTSSQSRFQIHNGAKIIEEYHQPLYAAAIHTEAILPAKPIAASIAPIEAAAAPVEQAVPSSEAVNAESDAISVESA